VHPVASTVANDKDSGVKMTKTVRETCCLPFQELIFRLEGFKPFGWYLTLIQFACYVVFGVTELSFKKDKKRRHVQRYNLYGHLF